MEPVIKMYFDGASKGNPGPSGGAYWIEEEDKSYGGYKFLGHQTNNYAEYNGLILGLKMLSIHSDKKIKVYGDSKLVIEQMKCNWKVKSEGIIPLFKEAQELIKNFDDISFIHIDRSLNKKADTLANIAVTTESYNDNIKN